MKVKTKELVVLGIDPGVATTGWAVIAETKKNHYQTLDYGCIYTDKKCDFPSRLQKIYKELRKIILNYHPQVLAMEQIFFYKNSKTAIRIGQVQGVIFLLGINCKLKTFEYTPLQIKQAVLGYGRAQKTQMQKNIKELLNLDRIPQPDDAADALGIAFCHLNSRWFTELKANTLEQGEK